jgi:hypothetical protein
MNQLTFAAPCGQYCGACAALGKECGGCSHTQGKPVWLKLTELEACQIYNCCVNKRHKEHCGLCAELPCKTYLSCHEDSISDEEAKEKYFDPMQKELKLRKKIGTEAWIKQKQQKG